MGSRDTVAVDILEEIGFERDSYVPYKMASALPTGYLKRLELARCLALRPEVILCDEVFSGLSMSEMASMVPLMEKLQMEGITKAFRQVAHDLYPHEPMGQERSLRSHLRGSAAQEHHPD